MCACIHTGAHTGVVCACIHTGAHTGEVCAREGVRHSCGSTTIVRMSWELPRACKPTRVCEDVRVAFLDVLAGEGPVALCGPGVMIVQNGHCARRPQPHRACKEREEETQRGVHAPNMKTVLACIGSICALCSQGSNGRGGEGERS